MVLGCGDRRQRNQVPPQLPGCPPTGPSHISSASISSPLCPRRQPQGFVRAPTLPPTLPFGTPPFNHLLDVCSQKIVRAEPHTICFRKPVPGTQKRCSGSTYRLPLPLDKSWCRCLEGGSVLSRTVVPVSQPGPPLLKHKPPGSTGPWSKAVTPPPSPLGPQGPRTSP